MRGETVKFVGAQPSTLVLFYVFSANYITHVTCFKWSWSFSDLYHHERWPRTGDVIQ